jgi:hypothetical protein
LTGGGGFGWSCQGLALILLTACFTFRYACGGKVNAVLLGPFGPFASLGSLVPLRFGLSGRRWLCSLLARCRLLAVPVQGQQVCPTGKIHEKWNDSCFVENKVRSTLKIFHVFMLITLALC